jgi:glycosyltransferase involved in cell wall biosynthesis
LISIKITALLVTYRRPEFLRRAISSVLGQTYSNLKLVVFDDASGDETKHVVQSFSKNDKRINYHCHQNNIGRLSNFRYAFESVETPYFSILSDDDCLSMNLYEDAIKVLENNPNVMFVILNTLMIDEKSNLKSHKESTNKISFHKGVEGFEAFHSGSIPVTWTGMVFRKELTKIYKEMDDRYDVGHDIRFLCRAASLYEYAYLSKVGAFFTQHPESNSLTIKDVDLVHQGVQISRYIEVFYDDDVSQEVKDKAVFFIKRLLLKKPNFIKSLKEITKNFIIFGVSEDEQINKNISDYEYAGYHRSAAILRFFYRNKIIKFFVLLTFGTFYKKKLINDRLRMQKLQNGTYKKYFNYISKS